MNHTPGSSGQNSGSFTETAETAAASAWREFWEVEVLWVDIASKTFLVGYLFVFVEYLCNRSPKIEKKNIKNYSSILAIVNRRNWLDHLPPLNTAFKHKSKNLKASTCWWIYWKACRKLKKSMLLWNCRSRQGRDLWSLVWRVYKK